MMNWFNSRSAAWNHISGLMIPALLLSWPAANARTWTDNKGRAIEAEILRVEDDTAVVNKDGKEVRLPLGILSEQDKEFVAKWREENKSGKAGGGAAAGKDGDLTLDGKPIERGSTKMTVIEKPFSKETMEELARDVKDNTETSMKLALAVPKGFDPSIPQKYFIVVTAVNNDGERAAGNIGKFGRYAQTCLAAGWACLAVDANNGFPKYGAAMNEAMALLGKEWSGFKSSTFATGGFSGGAKGCWFQAALLLHNEYNMRGVFMGGCNEDRSGQQRKNFKLSSKQLGKVRGYVSMGKKDSIASIAKSEAVMKSLKSNGVRDLRSAVHDGGHSLYLPHFEEALKWFAEP
jgi:hypothetical protein